MIHNVYICIRHGHVVEYACSIGEAINRFSHQLENRLEREPAGTIADLEHYT